MTICPSCNTVWRRAEAFGTRGRVREAQVLTGADRGLGSSPRQEVPTLADKQDQGIGEIIDLVKRYALQETVDPLKTIGRFLAFGLAGAFFLGIGLVLLTLGVLRLLQTEVSWFAHSQWQAAFPYGAVVVLLAVTAGFLGWRIQKGMND